jgi:hypothetical protein
VRLDRKLFELAVADLLLGRSILFLTKNSIAAEELAQRFTDGFIEIAAGRANIKPAEANPVFIRITNGAWIFFYDAADIEPDEVGGPPDRVYWPSEGLDYHVVSFTAWADARRAGHRWYPIEASPEPREADTAWDRLLADD